MSASISRFFPDPTLVTVDPFLQNHEAPKPEEKKPEEINMGAGTPCAKSKAATVNILYGMLFLLLSQLSLVVSWELFEIFLLFHVLHRHAIGKLLSCVS